MNIRTQELRNVAAVGDAKPEKVPTPLILSEKIFNIKEQIA